MSEKLPEVTFNGVPARRVWRGEDGNIYAEAPMEAHPRLIGAWIDVGDGVKRRVLSSGEKGGELDYSVRWFD